MSDWLPWLDYPGLSQNRLLLVGNLVRAVRTDALIDHRPEAGETNWSLGVRQYERTESAITGASVENPWLTVVAGSGGGASQYVFAVGGHPVRFCRGDEEEIASRYRAPCLPELQQRLNLGDDSTVGLSLRLVIENGIDGSPERLWLSQVDDESGAPVRSFLIPAMASNISQFVSPLEPVAEIPPVTAQAADDAVQDMTGSE